MLVVEARDSSEPRGRGTSAVGSSYQATASEDRGDFICAIVTAIYECVTQ
jgi:hypothetical protein